MDDWKWVDCCQLAFAEGFLNFIWKKDQILILYRKNATADKKFSFIDDNKIILDRYLVIENIFENDLNDTYHFAPHLINMIRKSRGQEIGTHTFSHYLTLAEGQTIEQFKSDVNKAMDIMCSRNINATSIIFPRNQFTDEHLKVCREAGILYYRGTEKSWYYKHSGKMDIEKKPAKLLRLIDAYINISGHNAYTVDKSRRDIPSNVPASKFLRPFNRKLKFLESLKLRRITTSMTYAAKNKLGYHLWWHPHNFGKNVEDNILFLESILKHYSKLKEKYDFQSKSMCEY